MTRLVCENHPHRWWPEECDCGAGMADPYETDDPTELEEEEDG